MKTAHCEKRNMKTAPCEKRNHRTVTQVKYAMRRRLEDN